ncbi:hypothetical protein CKO25_12405 [Thiocapsa imhoffii]|uniref:SsuA/THI5-like domain-containing protein n=1 Tax=Thiocapsa imhoffii TaxID=382777 RepID=A0A9X0WIZ7_9GAMM|nr:ABC transporter substrate-binding protein [Thiocapsa imhoffii]MBK1645431.1 hypothetical protein [Thiocapsa imhoffii]
MKRRRILIGLGALPLLTGTISCDLQPTLTIASHIWPGYEFLFLARARGWLPERVELRETASATDSLDRLVAGEVMGAGLTLDEVLSARAQGVPLTIVLVFNISAGADMLIAQPDIASLADLRGRRVGVETTAVGALMLSKLMATAGLREHEIEVVHLVVDPRTNPFTDGALADGPLAAVITYHPQATRLLAQGYRRLFDSRSIPEAIYDVLAVRTDLPRPLRTPLRELIAAHFRALAFKHRNPQTAAFSMAERLGVTGQQAAEIFSDLTLPGLDSNRALLGPDGRVHSVAERIGAFMIASGLLDHPDPLLDLTSAAFLPRRDIAP